MAKRGKNKVKRSEGKQRRQAQRRQRQIVEAVEQLFDDPPDGDDALDARLAGLDRRLLGQALVDRLEQGLVRTGDEDLLLAVLGGLGPGLPLQRLKHLLVDEGAPLARRALAGEAMPPEQLEPLLAELPEEVVTAVMMAPAVRLLADVLDRPDGPTVLADLLEQLPPAERDRLLYMLGHQRRLTGTPAALAWAEALRRESLAELHPTLRDSVVAEGGPVGEALLQELHEDAPGDAALARALQQLRDGVVPEGGVAATLAGQAFLGSCDGQGAFLVLARLDNPDGSCTLTSICIRAGADLRNGLVAARFDPAELDDYLEMLQEKSSCGLWPLPLEQASALLIRALHRTREMDRPLPEDLRAPLALVCRGAAPVPVSRAPLPRPQAAPPTLEQVRDLLMRIEYAAWFFDEDDLEHAGIELPEDLDSPPGLWFEQAGASLARRPEIVRRLASMLEHQSRWHTLGQQQREAALCAGLLQQLAAGFAASPLARGMLEAGLEMAAMSEWDDDEYDDDDDEPDGGPRWRPARRPDGSPPPLQRLVARLLDDAQHRGWGRMALRRALGAGGEPADYERDLTHAYQLHGWANSRGERLIDLFGREHEGPLPADVAPYLPALLEARFSLWEVQQVRHDEGLELRDVVFGDQLFVRERSATHHLRRLDLLLAWVMELGDHHELGAVAAVPRAHVATVQQAMQSELDRERAKHPDWTGVQHLRQVAGPVQRALRRAVETWQPPRIVNMDGHETVFCEAVFDLQDRAAALGRLTGRDDFDVDAEAGEAVWLDPAGRPQLPGPLHLGRLVLSEKRLRLETNSHERLARGKKLLSELLGDLARHRVDTVKDLDAALAEQKDAPSPPSRVPPAVEAELISRYLQDHMARWIDMPLPALDGKTPRQVVRTAAGRRRVDAMLKDQEHSAQGMPGGDRVDFDGIRRELGLQ